MIGSNRLKQHDPTLSKKRFKGKEILPFISDLAKLRMEVFKEYPYLYVGNMEYETEYLNIYTSCPESVMALVFINNKVVGASTAIPLEFETEECKKTFYGQLHNFKDIYLYNEFIKQDVNCLAGF